MTTDDSGWSITVYKLIRKDVMGTETPVGVAIILTIKYLQKGCKHQI